MPGSLKNNFWIYFDEAMIDFNNPYQTNGTNQTGDISDNNDRGETDEIIIAICTNIPLVTAPPLYEIRRIWYTFLKKERNLWHIKLRRPL